MLGSLILLIMLMGMVVGVGYAVSCMEKENEEHNGPGDG